MPFAPGALVRSAIWNVTELPVMTPVAVNVAVLPGA